MLAGRCIFFYVYLYVCILLLEVYIQGCVFIYKNAYLNRMYKKEKCIHYVAHFFLPAAAGRMLKMYTHACTHKKPSQRAGYISKNVYICRHIFSVVLCIHMHTLFFLLSQFRRHSSAAGIPTKIPLSRLHRLQPYIFLHLFFFVSPNDRQRWQLRTILHKTKQEEKSCKRKSNKHPLQFHQDKEQRGNRRTKKQKKYKNKRICRNKKNVFVNRGFPRTSIKNKRKIKKSKG